MGSNLTDVVVIGGGAAGMMAAITAARDGCRVTILEHKEMPGKKILATGNGRCNFTNTEQGLECYRGDTPAFVLPCLKAFDARAAIAFFKELGVWTKIKDGYCYPRNMQASAVRNALLGELQRLGVHICNDIGIRRVKKENGIFRIETKSGDHLAKTCILATGGMASPGSGSDGSGYVYAKQLGHHLVETVPALVPLVSDARWLKAVKGVRAEGKITLWVEGKEAAADCGELQLTDYGISGIPAFQVSRFAGKALAKGQRVLAELDFLPEISAEELYTWLLTEVLRNRPSISGEELLGGLVNQKLARVVAADCRMPDLGWERSSQKEAEKIVHDTVERLKGTKLRITGTGSFQKAQVTAGGICTDEVNADTMESRLNKDLFFAGEILDVDGICGGYNLQWAWASGHCAGSHAARSVQRLKTSSMRVR